jgi:undecaprenyl-diphosphatase
MKKVLKLWVLLSIQMLWSFDLDVKVQLDEGGFWGSHYDIPKALILGAVGMAVYEGTESRLGKTAWKSMDAGILSQILTEGTKHLTGRLRPREAQTPNQWGKGGKSFFSGHVSGTTALVTPFILEYKDDYPLVQLLWALPLHQMGGRVKAQAHWQSDVIVAALVGYASGYWAHQRDTPFLLSFSSDKVVIGWKHKF